MARAVLMACLPWFELLLMLILAAWVLVRSSRAQLRLGRLFELHRDEVGSVQSLSFVLTLPLFIMIMMMIVQVSQLMIGTVVVHYAAFAAARSAAVWIPAAMADPEGPCCISSYAVDPDAPDQVAPELDPTAADYGPSSGGLTYKIEPGSPKFNKVASAAVLACVPISPSRDLGLQAPTATQMDAVLKNAYGALSPSSSSNPAIGPRLDRKLAYALQYTDVQIRFVHKNREPPLQTYYEQSYYDPRDYVPSDYGEFYDNEVGWQDTITVTVNYQFPLLPGPGRMLARYVVGPSGTDKVAATIQKQSGVYTYPLRASATIGNEGEKSVVTYVYQ
ncbi:MAG: TadE/TadG family type IV pilus assembly protein [Thermoguttaceae bacterium]